MLQSLRLAGQCCKPCCHLVAIRSVTALSTLHPRCSHDPLLTAGCHGSCDRRPYLLCCHGDRQYHQSSVRRLAEAGKSGGVSGAAAASLTPPLTTAVESKRFGSKYLVVFHFPYIVHARVLTRLKLYQTALTLSLPVLRLADLVEMENTHFSAMVVMSTIAMAMLYAVGEVSRRLIGQVSVSRDGATVILSHLTFFGRRRDVTLPLTDLQPVTDSRADSVANAWFVLRRYSQPSHRFYMTLWGGGVLDKQRLQTVIGNF